ncbi:MAG: CDP-alcohol phosphatidyltransferase family protein [Saccharofermentanales bacterium]
MKITVPNIITSIRFFAIPFMAYYIYASAYLSEKYNLVAFILFLSIWATDVLDGYIARNFNQVSDFGKLFDPFVDKLFQFVTALMMAIAGKIPFWVPVIIFIKELIMIVGGTVLFKKYRLVVYSKWYGKLATILFVMAFCVLFFIPKEYVTQAGYLFILPLAVSFYAYSKYFFDNVIPIIYHKSKRYLASETLKNGIEANNASRIEEKKKSVANKAKFKREL